MNLEWYEIRDQYRQKRSARWAFRDYARNGWQSPWIRKNRLWELIRGK